MAHPDDYTDDYPPWGKRERIVPLRTYSGRIVYPRKVHTFTERDVARIMAKISPPDNADNSWYGKVIQAIKDATISMLERLLPFMGEKEVVAIYDWAYDIVDKIITSAGLDDATVRKYLNGLQNRLKGL